MPFGTPTELDVAVANGPSSIVSDTIAPSANALLLAACMIVDASPGTAEGASCADTLSGTGSWTTVGPFNITSDNGRYVSVTLFYAIAGSSPGSGTITITYTEGASRSVAIFNEVTGHDPTTPVAQSAGNTGLGTTLTVTLGGSPASDSMVFGFVADEYWPSANITPGSGFTELSEIGSGGPSARVDGQSQYDIDSADTTCDWSTLDDFGNAGIAVEISIAAVAGQPTPIRTQGVPTGSGYKDRIGGWN